LEWSGPLRNRFPITEFTDIFYSWISQFAALAEVTARWQSARGQVLIGDACQHPLPTGTAAVWFTDPPYYDAVPYGYLADCFYVWIKRLGLETKGYPFFSTRTSPIELECVADYPRGSKGSGRDPTFFEQRISLAAKEGRRVLDPTNGAACVVFAHRTTEGWESLLSGLISAGWLITPSWPIATELRSRLNARETASLATSVHLICRPSPDNS
jgi:adenine-specific DNA methylase